MKREHAVLGIVCRHAEQFAFPKNRAHGHSIPFMTSSNSSRMDSTGGPVLLGGAGKSGASGVGVDPVHEVLITNPVGL